MKLSFIFVLLVTNGCEKEDGRAGDYYYRSDMKESSAYKPLENPLEPARGAVPVESFIVDEIDQLGIIKSAELIGVGRKLYKTNCALCHGMGGKGDGVIAPHFYQPADLTKDRLRRLSNADLDRIIRYGEGVMPPHYERLAVEERAKVIEYVGSLLEE